MIFLGGTLQSAVHQAEEGHEIHAGTWGREGTVALCRSGPAVRPDRRGSGRAEELRQPVVAELPTKVPQPQQVLEELVHGGPSRVVADNCAELRLCRLGHQRRAENLRPVRLRRSASGGATAPYPRAGGVRPLPGPPGRSGTRGGVNGRIPRACAPGSLPCPRKGGMAVGGR